MSTISLEGIRPDSLGGYFAGIGVLRVMAQQQSTAVRGGWRDGCLVLQMSNDFSSDDLVDQLQVKWHPTPFEKWWKETQEASKKDSLALSKARAMLSDERVGQLDAIMVQANRRVFNDLLGTGGNVGKRDLAMVWEKCKELTNHTSAKDWLRYTLFGTSNINLPEVTGGGTWFVFSNKTFNSGQGWFREGRLSPWSFLLAIEGALLVRGSVHRRLGTTTKGRGVFPFLCRPAAPLTSGQVAQCKAEFWAPLWNRFATLAEIEFMLHQGLSEIGGRPATAPHEFAVATVNAAVDAGILSLARFELRQTTSAQVYEALPREQISVRRGFDGVRAHSRLLLPLIETGWINRLPTEPNRANQRGRFIGLRGPIEAAIIHLTERPDNPERWRALLLLLARTQRRIDRNKDLREECSPVPLLDPAWFDRAWSEPPAEIRIARSIASIGCSSLDSRLLMNIFGVEASGKELIFPKVRPRRAVWHEGRPVDAMLAVLRRRLIDAGESEMPPLDGFRPCQIDDAAAFLASDAIDDDLIALWIPPLTLLDWSQGSALGRHANLQRFLLHPLYTLLHPLCTPKSLIIQGRPLFPRSNSEGGKPHAATVRTLTTLLLQNSIEEAVALARRCYLAGGWRTFNVSARELHVDAERLAAALLPPVNPHQLGQRLSDQWIIQVNRS